MNFSHVPVFENKPRLHSSALSLNFSRGWQNTADWWRGKKTCSQDSNFVCVCVFVPPSSVLQISQLCEELKGVESTLSAPISSLRFVPLIYTQTHTYTHSQICLPCALSLCSPHLISPSLSFSSSFPLTSRLSYPLYGDLFLGLSTPFSVVIVNITTEQMMFFYYATQAHSAL